MRYIKRKLHQRRTNRQQENSNDRAARSTSRATWCVAAFTIVIAGVGVLQWKVLSHELDVMRGQLDQMKSSGVQADKSIEAVNRMANETHIANDIATKALVAANRPWVGISRVESGPFKAGQELKINIVVKNSGRSPGLDVKGCFTTSSKISPEQSESSIRKLLSGRKGCKEPSQGVILPNAEFAYTDTVTAESATQEEISAINNGIRIVVVVGALDYTDSFGNAHKTLFCGMYIPKSSVYASCPAGNGAT